MTQQDIERLQGIRDALEAQEDQGMDDARDIDTEIKEARAGLYR